MTDMNPADEREAPPPGAETPAPPPAEPPMSRRDRILRAAAQAFAAHGFRGSSLRDIARDAGCSLTLLDHHFGGKSQLLDAVLQQQHQSCDKRLQGLRDALATTPEIGLAEFVERWANYEFDLYSTPDGRLYLSLLLRLSTETEVDAQRRRDLDCSQALVMKAFARARPDLSQETLLNGWLLSSAALYAAIVRADEEAGGDMDAGKSDARRRVVAFLLAGLEGAWQAEPSEAAPA